MNFLILTGMSGAGKSSTIKFLEDIGFFCVDNLPPLLISRFSEACFDSDFKIEKVALGIDIRGNKLFNDLFLGLNNLSKEYKYKILFLDASDNVLIKRFKETRRIHPLAKNERIEYGIKKERELLSKVKNKSDYIIDTSHLLLRDLKEEINNIFIKNKKFKNLIINILSFGFKYGLPDDADLVFDVRFIKNPYYILEFKHKTGNDKEVVDYIFSFDISKKFLNKLFDMVEFLIPNYILEGKNQLVIAIGCTGGKHRSVVFGNALYKYLYLKDENVNINHIDINKKYGE